MNNQTNQSELPLWRNPDYMLLWGGQVISATGSGASSVVFLLLILALTNSPTAAGVASALYSIPYLMFSLPAGALVDRWDRKRVMILSDIGQVLVLGSIPLALWLGWLTIWQIYVSAFLEGTFFVFFNVAQVAALPRVVTKTQLPAATAQNDAAFGVAGIVGPPLGSFLYQTLGRAVPFIMDALSFVVSAFTLSLIGAKFQMERSATKRNLGAEIVEGVRWLWSQPLIRFIAFLTGGVNAMLAARYLIVIVVGRELGASEAAIGVIIGIGSIGAIIGSMIGGFIQKRFSFGQAIIGIVWIIVIIFPFHAIVPNYIVLGVVTAIIVMMVPIYNVVQVSYRLSLIPDELQGRVNSAVRLIAYGFQPLGAILCGFLLERFGSTITVLVFTAWMVIWGTLAALNRHVREARPVSQLG